jgi:hypothetical protein
LIQSIDIIIINAQDKIRIELIIKEQYVIQTAREIYLTSICQLKTLFDLFYAAQFIEMSADNVNALNKRLQ